MDNGFKSIDLIHAIQRIPIPDLGFIPLCAASAVHLYRSGSFCVSAQLVVARCSDKSDDVDVQHPDSKVAPVKPRCAGALNPGKL